MTADVSRRRFLAAALASTAVLSGRGISLARHSAAARTYPSRLYKARIADLPTDALCERWKAAGFEGMEIRSKNLSVEEARKSRLVAEKHGLRIHSMMRSGWADFGAKDPEKLKDEIEATKTALRVASACGADALLLVPCLKLTGPAMPDPWDFDIDFDPRTLKVKSVAEGDNSAYAAYIEAQNDATESAIRAVEALIPVAAGEGVRIAIENVWNNLWCTPKFFAAFVQSFDHPWVGAYFDLGNHEKYARCEEWLRALGSSIVKLHIKGFKVDEVKGRLGGGPGDWTAIDQATIDWKSVRNTLADVNRYSGWITIEENRRSDEEYGKILDDLFGAGAPAIPTDL